ncbi:MAG: hypothetical protein DRH08_12295 [Deltaproteobacteria bacterium]|nr:MAG: hypothetical protein DRH08_12295 [Deltaproteobacteria bacterium]
MINKNFVELYALLSANEDKKVADILEACEELMQSAVTDKVTRMTEDGVLEIFCWYHKVWERTDEIEYGSKKSNKTTGLNTFCKVGVNCWTKQQRDFKTESAKMLDMIAAGKVKPEDIAAKLNELGLERDRIESREEYFARKDAEKSAKERGQLAKS